jgi:hypothetical protein
VPTAAADRSWFSRRAKTAWAGILALLLVGSAVAWITVGVSLCEESYSPGSSRFCNKGGWEASGAAFIAIVIAALVVPALGAVVGSRRLFRVGLALPVLLAVADVLLSATFGAQ